MRLLCEMHIKKTFRLDQLQMICGDEEAFKRPISPTQDALGYLYLLTLKMRVPGLPTFHTNFFLNLIVNKIT